MPENIPGYPKTLVRHLIKHPDIEVFILRRAAATKEWLGLSRILANFFLELKIQSQPLLTGLSESSTSSLLTSIDQCRASGFVLRISSIGRANCWR